MAGDRATTRKTLALADLKQLLTGAGVGLEDVAMDWQGRLYTGMVDGRYVIDVAGIAHAARESDLESPAATAATRNPGLQIQSCSEGRRN